MISPVRSMPVRRLRLSDTREQRRDQIHPIPGHPIEPDAIDAAAITVTRIEGDGGRNVTKEVIGSRDHKTRRVAQRPGYPRSLLFSWREYGT